jgi:hypothetical protein
MKSIKKVDWVASRRISDMIDARLGECLANVVRAFLDFPESLPSDAAFIEGIHNYGGQFSPHTWIETADKIIELSLVHDKNPALRDHVEYFPIQQRDKEEIHKLYGDKPHEPGTRLIMIVGYDDPRVVKLLEEIDTPPGLRHHT